MRKSFAHSFNGLSLLVLGTAFLLANLTARAQDNQALRVAIVGLTHGHVAGFLPQSPSHPEIQLVGIVEANAELAGRYKAQFHLDAVPFYSTINECIEKQHPAALWVYTATSEHRRIIQDAAAYGVNVIVEKPLATTLSDALAIRHAAEMHHVQVLVNYETTWYASNNEALNEARERKLGDIWKVVVHDGHRGPKEIGVQPEFLDWLSDPQQNGAGALFDFGCYGADLMTVLMRGQSPLSVTAALQTVKPHIYPRVDDDATVILQYPKAQAILQASWNWPFDRKDMEIYGATGEAFTIKRDRLRVRYAGEEQDREISAPPLAAPDDDPIHYLVSVVRGHQDVSHSLGGIDTNVVVVQILDAARESARTGRTVMLHPLPND
jgi:glucose-fructose oxidoreductase